ncbi:MAG: MraY family glycosyltransferase [Candidatus Woesearchaeota archaeon]
MTPYSLIALLFSFLFTLYIIPKWIFRAKKANLLGIDVHKTDNRKVAEVGGLPVIAGFIGGLLIYIAFRVFVYQEEIYISTIFAVAVSILIATIIGMVDDILGWKIGLRQFQKAFLTFSIAIPIMVINAGDFAMNIPFFGLIDFGLFFPILLIPLAIMFTANAFNMVGGFNGLEAGMGIIILSTLSYICYVNGFFWVAIMGVLMVGALFAFLIYNWFPSKIFPGDTLTYSVGALFGIMAILGNVEKFAIILFSLYILQFFLKLRGKMQKESFILINKDGSLKKPKIYGIEHIAFYIVNMFKKNVYEKDIVYVLLSVQLVIVLMTLLYFFI